MRQPKFIPDTGAYLQNIIAAVHESILVLDAQWRIFEASEGFYHLFRIAPEVCEGQPIFAVCDGLWDFPAMRILLQDVVPLQPNIRNYEFSHDFGRGVGKLYLSLNVRHFNCCDPDHPDNMMFIIAINDITHLKRAQESLEHKVAELKTQNEALDAFAYTVAHDLKNPISSMMGFADLIQSYQGRMSPDEVVQNARAILDSGEHLKQMIHSLLLLAGVERAEVPLQLLDMHPIVEQAQKNVRAAIREHNAEIHLPDAWPPALGYAPWVEAVWTNYISNAIKYGGTPPIVRLGAETLRSGQVRYWVQDNGRGLTPAQQSRLFRPFIRLHGNTAEGHGLGLSVVQMIMERLNGSVRVDSSVGSGSQFSFILPAS